MGSKATQPGCHMKAALANAFLLLTCIYGKLGLLIATLTLQESRL